MRIAISQSNYHIGNFEHNFQKMKQAIDLAKQDAVDLLVFSELSVCGYPPRDFLEFEDFIEQCEGVIDRLAKETDGIAIVVGSPSRNPRIEGKDLFNSAYFIVDGKVEHIAHKALLPTYDVFDEYRYFEPASEFQVVEYKGKRIAITVCEDIWNVGNDNPMYTICPMDEMIGQQPDFMVNLSASPFTHNKAATRLEVVKANAERYKLPIFYVNHIGAQTELLFDGGSIVINQDEVVVDELPYFEESYRYYDLDEVVAKKEAKENAKNKIALINDALVMGIRDYFGKLGFKKATLGMSGGIDSAVTLALAVEALGKENVLAVMMPSEYSSDHSVSDSERMVENLGCMSKIIPIQEAYSTFLGMMEPHFEGLPFGVAEENLQARSRGVILMALSNKLGYILLNTTNKSEAAVGYGTLYGDLCGGISVIGDVYKTEVFELARYINRNGEVIPENIITKPPSAELRPDQKDSDSLPDYDILDEVLFQYIEERKSPADIIEMGFDKALVDRVLRMVNMSEWKRYQTAPMLRVSPKAFGMGRRMPIVAKYLA